MGKLGYQNWRDYKGSLKPFMWQLLNDNNDIIIVWDSE